MAMNYYLQMFSDTVSCSLYRFTKRLKKIHINTININNFGDELELQGSVENYVRTIIIIRLLFCAYMMCLLLKNEDDLMNV
jgi:hypothetical protein